MQVSSSQLEILSRSRLSGNQLILPAQLERSTYTALAKVIEAAGGKWDRKAGAHVFDGAATDAIEPILLTGEVINAKQEFGCFFTPREVAERVVTLAELSKGQRVLEPSAGHGSLAAGAFLMGCKVDCIEILEANIHVLCSVAYAQVVQGDFLQFDRTPVYDRVLMNPPFAKRADIKHFMHALGFLRPGGKVVAIMSAGVRFRQDRAALQFRETVERLGGEFEDLPDGAFASSGTQVRTCIVSARVPG